MRRVSILFKEMNISIFILLALALTACSAAAISTQIPPTTAPTDTTVPTDTPLPTNTPTTTYTPRPTNTPKPTNTPRPTTTFTPLPEPIILSGKGDSVIDVEKWRGPALAHITYGGGGNFVVWHYGDDGEKIELLVNTIGKYEGTVPLDFLDSEYTTRFVIESSGEWEISVLPFEQIRMIEIPGTFEGKGDDVVYIEGRGRPDVLKVDASQAERNFIILGLW